MAGEQVYSRPEPPVSRSTASILMHSAIMFGREMCYAVEGAFATPVLLSVGLPRNLYSLVWFISPMLGFVLQPLLGSASDTCTSPWGRRRPFILVMSLLMLLGLALFLNSDAIVEALVVAGHVETFWPIAIAMLGIVLFDFSADLIDGPIKAYLFDVCSHADKMRGLHWQALLTGVGGVLGYLIGTVDWETTILGHLLGSEYHVIFMFVLVIFSLCLIIHLCSMSESPLAPVLSVENFPSGMERPIANTTPSRPPMTLKLLLKTLANIPAPLRCLCISHLLGWTAFLAIMLFFTDFMGQIVYKGNPYADHKSVAYILYEHGVEIGCWGLSINALVSSAYSYVQRLLKPLVGLQGLYFAGYLVFGIGTAFLALFPNVYATLALCSVFGVMSSTLYTVPFSLVAEIHKHEEMLHLLEGETDKLQRGSGIDCAALTCMVQLAQVAVGVGVGALVTAAGTTAVVPIIASIVALIGCIFIGLFVHI
uniref:membrane-associated transporter protein n=1 Tax=Myxine glutinosa TaxID=7769 RepID=UPI00358ED006